MMISKGFWSSLNSYLRVKYIQNVRIRNQEDSENMLLLKLDKVTFKFENGRKTGTEINM